MEEQGEGQDPASELLHLISSFARHIRGPVRIVITAVCVSPVITAVCVSRVITGHVRVTGHHGRVRVTGHHWPCACHASSRPCACHGSSLAMCVSRVITAMCVCVSRVITAVCVSRGSWPFWFSGAASGRAHKKAACHSTPAHRFVVGFVHFV